MRRVASLFLLLLAFAVLVMAPAVNAASAANAAVATCESSESTESCCSEEFEEEESFVDSDRKNWLDRGCPTRPVSNIDHLPDPHFSLERPPRA